MAQSSDSISGNPRSAGEPRRLEGAAGCPTVWTWWAEAQPKRFAASIARGTSEASPAQPAWKRPPHPTSHWLHAGKGGGIRRTGAVAALAAPARGHIDRRPSNLDCACMTIEAGRTVSPPGPQAPTFNARPRAEFTSYHLPLTTTVLQRDTDTSNLRRGGPRGRTKIASRAENLAISVRTHARAARQLARLAHVEAAEMGSFALSWGAPHTTMALVSKIASMPNVIGRPG
ncbi:hypothetical protein V8D89_011391 [Ganoderma adspersum]